MKHKLLSRGSAIAVGAAVLSAAGAGAAQAHVTVDPDQAAAGSYSVLTFQVPHGCQGSATTSVAIKVPKQVQEVTPTVNPGWTISQAHAKLDKPYKNEDGNEVTKRVSQIAYRARKPLPDKYRDTFELLVKLPEHAAGKKLVFPAVQKCVKGENAWIQTPSKGQDADDLEYPAPVVQVTAANGHDGSSDGSPQNGDSAQDSTSQSDKGQPVPTLTYVALAVGIVGVLLGIGSIISRRRR